MAQQSIERQLLEVLQRKPDIDQPGRLFGHLQNEIGLTGSKRSDSQLASLQAAIERLEARGRICVYRNGKVMNRVVLLR